MAAVPRIADVQCSRLQFMPGDRLLVKSRVPITKEERRKIHRMVQKWAGDHVEVLVIDLSRMDIEIEPSKYLRTIQP